MRKIIKYALLLLCIVMMKVNAQEKKTLPPDFNFLPSTEVDVPDSVWVFFRKGPLVNNQSGERMKIKPNVDGSFSFSPSFIQPVYWFEIYFMYYKSRQRAKPATYYAEPNDQLKVIYAKAADTGKGTIPKMKLTFSGKGAEKYKVVELLGKIKTDLSRSLNEDAKKEFGADSKTKDDKIGREGYYKSAELKVYLNSILEKVKGANRQSQDTLLKYKSLIGNNITNYLSYELSSSGYFSSWIDYLYRIGNSPNFRQTITDFYFLNRNSVIKEVSDPLVKYSKDYKFNKLLEIKYETGFRNKGKSLPYYKLYDAVKAVKNSGLRDILLSYLMYEPVFTNRITNTDSQDSCIRDALAVIKSPELLEPVQEQLLFFRGSQIPDFTFVDQEGKPTSLADLKGKVFMIDFYFYGCKGCIAYAKRFKEEIYPEFVHNPKFKVLSVSVDKKREHWISAMNSNLYNERDYINLSAGNLSWKHPFLKHFNRASFPFILLVDKNGRLISKIENESSPVIADFIRKSLNEKNSK
ncbi:TlpA family protein disulfide reductase [Pedobacter heparinus]|uniref:Alkyl hydroperoxide reductase/ Thiol specific antioxidant/ Mal allergen n=1 Tax=Pedobacter heparinus (strain ATCC 13125 / DSM 2366 / CIP 104194 / JCM 7457 / NBRC 12017 / NCIMB 9290 / NRRL B-14731 / HIM 762-3) TaxID=485917 RepID=C6XWB4_PEDHD|nr:thioredoxin-like domain-containing protein [Pedobacter heparinus]ACU04193.1 alkyl hydroperoxide reductase/ Thiol specific antioxidant/ Mal allergen [Pedobacter heparinus DSM 2366]